LVAKLDGDGRIILNSFFKERVWEHVDWIYLAQSRWRAIVNTIMKVRFPEEMGNFLTT
jgi:hypothetical protein